ncbi:MAG: hypothetical protein WCT05_06030 [Lentisphaeria bacterium]
MNMQELATKYHTGQKRKGKAGLPYIVHPEMVVKLLEEWGVPKTHPLLDIAWGHDLLEDTSITEQKILAVSSEEILENIKLLTCKKNKTEYMSDLANSGSLNAILVKAADRLCNTKDFIELKGKVCAGNYLKEADCIKAALLTQQDCPYVRNALIAWTELEKTLEH